MKTNQLFTLIRDTKPTAHIWSKLDATYWNSTLSQLKHNSFELGTTDAGISFRATFRQEGSRLRAILTPHSAGHVYRHLTKWRWYDVKPKLVGEDRVETNVS